MKKLTKCISMILAFVLMFNFIAQPTVAAEYNKSSILDNFGISQANANAKQVFDDLSPEAQQIFLEYLVKENKELLQYHKKFVGDASIDYYLNKTSTNQTYNSNAVYTTSSQVLSDLNNKLIALNLKPDEIYAFMGAASSMLAQGVAISASTVVIILLAVGISAVVIANWDTISAKWPGVVNAFQSSFASGYSTAISSGFSQARTSYANTYTDMSSAEFAVKSAYLNTAAGRHVSLTLVNNMKSRPSVEIYYGPKNRTVLIMIQIPTGTIADVQDTWAHATSSYSTTNFNVGGATLFLLYDFRNKQIFHAHLRVLGSRHISEDIKIFREANNLTWRIKPLPMKYEAQFESTIRTARFPGMPLDR